MKFSSAAVGVTLGDDNMHAVQVKIMMCAISIKITHASSINHATIHQVASSFVLSIAATTHHHRPISTSIAAISPLYSTVVVSFVSEECTAITMSLLYL